jgi:cytochrome b
MRSVGHNPLGGLMVLLMLFLATLQVVTGLFATDDITWSGPYNAAVRGAVGSWLTSLHHLNFNFIWAAMGVHIAAILYYSRVKNERLVPAMLTGRKPADAVPDGQAISSSELWKAVIVIAVSCGVVYWVLSAAPPEPSNI